MRLNVALVFLFILFFGCRDKVICPAFQSTYILDDEVRATYYSYLWKLDKDERTKYLANQRSFSADSIPVTASVGNGTDYFAYVEEYMVSPNEVRKSKYGIVKYEPYWLKNYELKSAPMENVLSPPVEIAEDTLGTQVDEGDFVASDFSDTINVAGDTTSVALKADVSDTAFVLPTLAKTSKPKAKKETVYLYRYDPQDEMLNVEQQYYNKHFGQQLYKKVEVNPPAPEEEQPADSLSSGLFSGLKAFFGFGKKQNKESADEEPLPADLPDTEPAADEGFADGQEETPDPAD